MIVQLLTSDRHTYEVDDVVWAECMTLKNLVEDIDDHDTTLPMPNVTSVELVPIIDFYQGLVGLVSLEPHADVKSWESNFLSKFTPVERCNLMIAANYLAAETMISSIAASIASSISGKTTLEIREMLHITNDFTPEEEETIKRETAWAFV
jgi:S-phase kinase-associated protein 1